MRITSFDGEITLLEFWEPSAFRTSEHSLTFLRSMKSNLINNLDPKTLTSHVNILRIIAQATVELVLARYAKIGRPSCRERVFPYVAITVVAVSLKKKKK